MKKLYALWGNYVHFVFVLTRQDHPGPGVPAYDNFEEKFWDSHNYKQYRDIPWPVLVDDLEGTVHQVYGGIADPIYLIDVDGRVAYYNMWAYAPTMYRAIDSLMKQGRRGVVDEGIDHMPHLLPMLTDGWKGIRLGSPQSFIDLLTATPVTGLGIWLGYQLRPVLAPLTLRAEPLPTPAKVALGVGAAAIAFTVWQRMRDTDRG